MASYRVEELIRRYVVAYNAFDIDGMCLLLTDDVQFANHAGGNITVQTTGLDAFRRLAEQSKGVFSEREQRITNVKLHDDGATVGILFNGRLGVDFPDGPAAGTILTVTGTSDFSFVAGKIARIIDRS